MIPSIGRVVWFWPTGHSRDAQPLPALVAYVHPHFPDTDEPYFVNLGAFAQDGTPMPAGAQMVPLYLPDDTATPQTGQIATWMPYQVAQTKPVEPVPVPAPAPGTPGNPGF